MLESNSDFSSYLKNKIIPEVRLRGRISFYDYLVYKSTTVSGQWSKDLYRIGAVEQDKRIEHVFIRVDLKIEASYLLYVISEKIDGLDIKVLDPLAGQDFKGKKFNEEAVDIFNQWLIDILTETARCQGIQPHIPNYSDDS